MLTHYKDYFISIHRKVRKTFYYTEESPESALQHGDMHKSRIEKSIESEKTEIRKELLKQKRRLKYSKKPDNSEIVEKIAELKSILKYILHFEKFTKYSNGKVVNAPNNLLETSKKKISYFQSIHSNQNKLQCDRELITTNLFLLEGKYWSATYCGKSSTIKHKDGMKEIATLLSRPYEDFHPADLFNITSNSETAYDDNMISAINCFLNEEIEMQSPFELGSSRLSKGEIKNVLKIFEKYRRDKYEEKGLDPDKHHDKDIEEKLLPLLNALRQDNPQQKKVKDLIRNRLNRAKEELKVFPALYEHVCRCIQATPRGKKKVAYYRYSPEKQIKWHVNF